MVVSAFVVIFFTMAALDSTNPKFFPELTQTLFKNLNQQRFVCLRRFGWALALMAAAVIVLSSTNAAKQFNSN